MNEQGPEGGEAGTAVPFDDAALDTPNCPACLQRMDAASTPAGGVYWACLHCGQTLLA